MMMLVLRRMYVVVEGIVGGIEVVVYVSVIAEAYGLETVSKVYKV